MARYKEKMTDQIIIKKNSRESIVISENEFNGRKLIDLRVFYKDEEELKPTKKGIAISVDKLDELVSALSGLSQEISLREETA